ncbi:MAG: aminotransferase class I/II-fold pyridoxal phosphate-dependent enzyme [Agathobacter sp.]|nr:aminotransferase class I/II-fold pyridoxal phosphate-dependent enzyme [Agathobacter sp.]MBQ2902678.1 aminotransferase class I/II-fold pyridoxal phosphate-dependent enzyme [Agathobacter sp.]
MIYFNCDYTEGAHPSILEKLAETNMEQTIGYGMDEHCKHAAELIKKACGREDVDVHFLVGGTQTNVTVIDAALRAHQGVICAGSGHINVHETGAVEASGHKCITIPSEDGKVYEPQVREILANHFANGGDEHMAQPKMLYISNPTEWGTIYQKEELIALYELCQEYGAYLFLDGARLGYGLMCKENDLTLEDIAQYTDVFYIGGTKVGALFGEAVVISNPALKPDFRYAIKQHGGMLAKGRLLGVQFETLFTDNLYFEIAKHAMDMAERISDKLAEYGVEFTVASPTNQIFVSLPKTAITELSQKYKFEPMGTKDETHDIIRICTSWATKEENVTALLADIERVLS